MFGIKGGSLWAENAGMCGRFGLEISGVGLAELLEIDPRDVPAFKPRYNIAPGQWMIGVRTVKGRRDVTRFRWGLVPSWAKDRSIGHKLINARSETVHTKPSFRSAFKHRRCLIPADGFYEWRGKGKSKQPYHIGLRDKALFFFAGLWESWIDPETGEVLETATVLTTGPNTLVEPIHDRMPVIVEAGDWERWLVGRTEDIHQVLKPLDASRMECWPVGPRVNTPRNDDAQLRWRQGTLF